MTAPFPYRDKAFTPPLDILDMAKGPGTRQYNTFIIGLTDKCNNTHGLYTVDTPRTLYKFGDLRYLNLCKGRKTLKAKRLQDNHNMTGWLSLGRQKRDSVNSLIPKSWRLPNTVPSSEEQRDVTGKYIQQYLSPREVEITETDAVGIVKNTTSGTWSAREVTAAFCHRAALAHQLVSKEVLN